MKRERSTILLFGSLTGQLSEAEQAEFQLWLDASPDNRELDQFFYQKSLHPDLSVYEEIDTTQGFEKVKRFIRERKRIIRLYRYSAAAGMIGIIGLAIYFSASSGQNKIKGNSQTTPADLTTIKVPEQAQLILSDGRTIRLDSIGSSKLIEQEDLVISRISDKHLIYTHSNTTPHKHQQPLYNTLSIPYGERWQISLADSTTIWLNAGSAISFPVVSGQADRILSMRGEGYFDVASESHKGDYKHFTVNVHDIEITVTGTRFNIQGYTEDSVINTVLLEGAVNITHKNHRASLKPGQAAIFNKANNGLKVEKTDTTATTSWISGIIKFENISFLQAMMTISRAYNVEIINEVGGKIDNERLLVEINTTMPLDTLTQKLGSMLGVTMTVEGNKLYIRPKNKK